ncbi:Anaerobic selenocysteine-containing dehydrogenase [Desulfacinum hydrothermale DSM 13146]|uniref:Anaerobic selenocysteine-containing dehydrogenase n=1 Tax=Desulfacinum hydrothermale DSM 13146 TaxID=1121390 RepID=A0A1W1XHY7_9BACT|nr:molybdopterin-dependent oxidoreductase [Desulfacinum hydrothermale]SMC23121.1 Anaerobic selenocysteine-containing dehydrogenase [Desulfacinum hydrothermale DSM 13146]
MSLGRRAFLQFVGGAIGGTLLTPIPWKLADDSAIWTQNWSWRPSPERGEITEATGTCLLCPGGCGIQVRLVNGHRAIYVKGNPDHVVNRGGLCPVGAAGLQYLYAPYRVTQPLKQTGKRGDPKGFQPISWDEALKVVAAKLTELRQKGQPHAVACLTGQSRSSTADLWKQFFAAYGSPNLYTMPCHSDSTRLAVALATGQEADLAFHLEKATYVLNFGAPLLEGWASPTRAQRLFSRWQTEQPGVPETEFVHVEPRCSLTASKADRWIACNPGTEAALALGIAHVLIREKLFDAAFVADQVFGFEDWTDAAGAQRKGFKALVLGKYSPQDVASLTGVDAEVIQELARQLARQKNAVVLWGPPTDTPNNLYHDLAFLALNALIGAFSSKAMISLVPPQPWQALPDPAMDMEAFKGQGQKPLGQPASTPKTKVRPNTVHAFFNALANGEEYPIELLFIHEANPAYGLPENALAVQALQKAGTVVSFSSYLDETSAYADLILPNHNAFERLDDVIGLPGAPFAFYAVATPILSPQYDTKATGDVLLSLAKALGGTVAQSLPWKSYQDLLKLRAAQIAQAGSGTLVDATFDPASVAPGAPLKPNFSKASDVWRKLTSGLCWVDAPQALDRYATPSSRLELACQGLLASVSANAGDELFMAHYAPLNPSGDAGELPLLLITHRSLSLAPGYVPNAPFMNKLLPDDLLLQQDVFVEVHPSTGKKLGLRPKAKALLKTPRGEAAVRVRFAPTVPAGVIALPEGLGHTAYDEYVQGKGVNANAMVEVQLDPVTGLGTVWATRAQLRLA